MKPGEQTKLLREVPATAIPAGSPLILPKDTEVTLTQSLGGSHTVAGVFGLARIEEKDQDALGL
ncbi:MAG: putative Fe-S cluster assembly protein SufT, partial [Verrucomicrobia bacterium]|nr:putative Fe-S cluster assembly protein SufT [Verrucomicrobiota bacterium]